jgi:hypothetical protein
MIMKHYDFIKQISFFLIRLLKYSKNYCPIHLDTSKN